uniref:Uncharacterized protein n=1 Tax=Anguilla anguilla TaxID=7936 RepID=A0A0E9Q1N0_ANGAN
MSSHYPVKSQFYCKTNYIYGQGYLVQLRPMQFVKVL